MLQAIVDTLSKEDFTAFLRADLDDDTERHELYAEMRDYIKDETLDYQRRFAGFEKIFFSELENIVIKKKQSRK